MSDNEIELPEICSWIDSKGGPTGLTIDDVFVIVDSYLSETPPTGYTFIPTIENVFGIIDYLNGFNGDAGTGCDYFIDEMIRNLVFPPKVAKWEPFDISYDCYNNTDQSAELWGCIINDETGTVMGGWQEVIEKRSFKHVTYTFFAGIRDVYHCRIEVGAI